MADLPSDARCETCRWWRILREDHSNILLADYAGTCHIRSVPGDFPIRGPDDFCGEWRARADSAPQLSGDLAADD